MDVIDKMILTAGPSISKLELKYAFDAAENGWNNHHSDYIKRFEEVFANYIGVKYALATSSCTGALHLALLGLDIGPGDEVIVPEISWIATASAVKYTGAEPVFCDIDSKTWVMDIHSVEKLITKKTKAIIPVHLYGNVVDMDPLIKLAKKHDIKIVEDAAPSIGTIYKGRKTGSFGDAAAFSFQGAKALVTGEGGMFVTNNQELYIKVKALWDHGRNPEKPLEAIQIGYKYKMSNIQAALGLAQIQRVEEIVEKKRLIFSWYEKRLKNIDLITLNHEYEDTRNIFWMTTIVLDKSIKLTRDQFMNELKLRNIDSRIVFSPMSSFPMFKSYKNFNPVSYDIPYRAINLPSGHNLLEDEVEYICESIREILGQKNINYQLSDRLKFRKNIKTIIKDLKFNSNNVFSDYFNKINVENIMLIPLGENHQESKIFNKLMNWRINSQDWFPKKFNVTLDSTISWYKKQYLEKEDRILFLIESNSNPIGHIGINEIDYSNRSCELDNVIRGEISDVKDIMFKSSKIIIDWTKNSLNMENIYLRVFSDNTRAINLYERLGFIEISRSPLVKLNLDGEEMWEERVLQKHEEVQRYFVTMKLLNGVENEFEI
jgi:dTDP-4-amino-4,6-dideoxygalactose transaminase/RimJ/RimL family protein N-acetyltransferase